MSSTRIARSPDLARLREEGYDVKITASGHLVIDQVPYVTPGGQVARGGLVSTLEMAGDITTPPEVPIADHIAYFDGEEPCNADGTPLTAIKHSDASQTLAEGLEVQRSFSSKPESGYTDYFEKMTRYITIISAPAQALDPTATAQVYPVVTPDEEEPSVFRYLDTASSRAGISALNSKFEAQRVAIIGAGGSGSYILDLVSKTPVSEIHLFDGDLFLQHNAFRAPGAATIEHLQARKPKAEHFAEVYGAMHAGMKAHPYYVDENNVAELDGMSFVFIAIDHGPSKKLIVEYLTALDTPFIDVGMGISTSENGLCGLLRLTTSTPGNRASHDRISFGEDEPDNPYTTNIQVADLNALNAALAVIRWKKHHGFYADFDREHSAIYTLDGNTLTNEYKA